MVAFVIRLGADSAVIKVTLKTANGTYMCVGNVIARLGCWSFLKGGFILDCPSSYAQLYFQVHVLRRQLHVLNYFFCKCLSGTNYMNFDAEIRWGNTKYLDF